MIAREIAFNILMTFERTGQRLEIIINKKLLRYKSTEKERKFIYNLTAGVLRNIYLFDWKIAGLFKGRYQKALTKLKIILRLALYEIDFLDHIPPHATINEYVNLAKKKINIKSAGIVNGILRNYMREGRKLDPGKKFKSEEKIISVSYSFPEWLVKRWCGFWGTEETEKLCAVFNTRPKFDLRVNRNKIDEEGFSQILIKNNISFEKSKYFAGILKVTDIQKISSLHLFDKGFCSVQDESGFLLSRMMMIKKNDTILDACAAPGGKFTAVLEQKHKEFRLTGLDIDFERLLKAKQNCKRLGFDYPCRLVQGDAVQAPFRTKFTKILLDTPCTGLGTIQKHPDIKWRRTLKEIMEFQKYQNHLLEHLADLVNIKGHLIYSTCTIDPAENEEVIKLFLEKNNNQFIICSPPSEFSEFIVDKKFIRTFPHKHNMDGSFAVILKKVS